MKITAVDEHSVTVNLVVSELVLVVNALNEVCNGVRDLDDDSEFATRLGHPRDEAQRLMAELRAALQEVA